MKQTQYADAFQEMMQQSKPQGSGIMHFAELLDKKQDAQKANGTSRVYDSETATAEFRQLMNSIGLSETPEKPLNNVINDNPIAASMITPMQKDISQLSQKPVEELTAGDFMTQMNRMMKTSITSPQDVQKMTGLGDDFQSRFNQLGAFQKANVAHVIGSKFVEKQSNVEDRIKSYNELIQKNEHLLQSERYKELNLESEQNQKKLSIQLEKLVKPSSQTTVGSSSSSASIKPLTAEIRALAPQSASNSITSALMLEKMLDAKTMLSPEQEQQYKDFMSPQPLTSTEAEKKEKLLTQMITDISNPELQKTPEMQEQTKALKLQLEEVKETVVKIKEVEEKKEAEKKEVDMDPKIQAIVTHNPEAPECGELSNAVAVVYAPAATKGENEAKGESQSVSVAAALPSASDPSINSSILSQAHQALATAEQSQSSIGQATSQSASM